MVLEDTQRHGSKQNAQSFILLDCREIFADGGFADLPRMKIVRCFFEKIDQNKLTESHTCFLQLQIQKYDDFTKMERHLMYVSESSHKICNHKILENLIKIKKLSC